MEDGGANKLVGYTLLIIGLVMIFYPVLNVYQVFTGQWSSYNLFKFEPILMDLAPLIEGAPKNVSIKQELLSSKLINTPMNFIAHIVLMGFIATAGFKVATIGTMLVRTIKVNLKEEKSVLFPPR